MHVEHSADIPGLAYILSRATSRLYTSCVSLVADEALRRRNANHLYIAHDRLLKGDHSTCSAKAPDQNERVKRRGSIKSQV